MTNLTILTPDTVVFNSNNSLSLHSPSAIVASNTAKLLSALKGSGEISIELWIKPNNRYQSGPATIAGLFSQPGTTVLELDQGLWGTQPNNLYQAQLQTSSDDSLVKTIGLPGSLLDGLNHVVYTKDTIGLSTLYVNGAIWAQQQIDGDFSNWADELQLVVGNSLAQNRPWLGEIHLLAIL